MRARLLILIIALVAYGYYLNAVQTTAISRVARIGDVYKQAAVQAEELSNNASMSTELAQYSTAK